MNSNIFNFIVAGQLDKCKSMLIRKGGEYATDDDRLHNFRVASRKLGVSMTQAADGMDMKHVVSIDDIIKTGKLPGYLKSREEKLSYIDEKFTDHMNYCILKKACLLEELGLA